MHIYIPNLKRSKDRRLHMEKQLKGTKLSYEFFECVVGAELSFEEVARKCDMESINKQNQTAGVEFFNRGIIGCTMTNQNIYRDIIKRNLDYAIYMEDDSLIPDNLNDILEYTQPHIQQGDVILLFWKAWNPLKLSQKTLVSTPFQFNYYIPENYRELTCGSAYIVTRKAAQKMLDLNTPIHTPPDSWWYFFDNKCIDRLLCAYPYVVEIADLRSTMNSGKYLFFRGLIDKYKIFPFYQYLKYKRNKHKKKLQKVILVN